VSALARNARFILSPVAFAADLAALKARITNDLAARLARLPTSGSLAGELSSALAVAAQ
jgi:hypothetical protein